MGSWVEGQFLTAPYKQTPFPSEPPAEAGPELPLQSAVK